jgi:hypothetical protein
MVVPQAREEQAEHRRCNAPHYAE